MAPSARTVLLAIAAPALASRVRHTFSSLRADLQPEAVALTLSNVESEWKREVGSFVRCRSENGTDCSQPQQRFRSSCATVVEAVLRASGGEKDVVHEYLGEVCGQSSLEGWRGDVCQNLTTSLLDTMSTVPSDNRDDMDVATPCKRFWSALELAGKADLARELEQEAEDEKRREAEKEKIRQEAAVAAKERAAAHAKRLQEEKKRREAEAAAVAKEAARQEAEANRTAQLLKSANQVANRAQEAVSSASDQMQEAKQAVAVATARHANRTAAAQNGTSAAGNATAAHVLENATNATK